MSTEMSESQEQLKLTATNDERQKWVRDMFNAAVNRIGTVLLKPMNATDLPVPYGPNSSTPTTSRDKAVYVRSANTDPTETLSV